MWGAKAMQSVRSRLYRANTLTDSFSRMLCFSKIRHYCWKQWTICISCFSFLCVARSNVFRGMLWTFLRFRRSISFISGFSVRLPFFVLMLNCWNFPFNLGFAVQFTCNSFFKSMISMYVVPVFKLAFHFTCNCCCSLIEFAIHFYVYAVYVF